MRYPWLVLLRKAVANSSYVVSQHALRRMGERAITIEDIEQCIRDGDCIGQEYHGRDPKVLIKGSDRNGEPFIVAITACWPVPAIITTMREDEGCQ